MIPNERYEKNTVRERNPQFSPNSYRDPRDRFQFTQNKPFSSPQVSSPRGNEKYSPASGRPYEPQNSQLPFSQSPSLSQQQPRGLRNQRYLWKSSEQKLAIGYGILISLLLLGILLGAIVGIAFKRQPQRPQTRTRQATAVQAAQMEADRVPTPTTGTIPNSNPTLTPTPLPSPMPTSAPSPTPAPRSMRTLAPRPTPTPKPVERVNVTVTSHKVKKVGTQYRYIFNIFNNDSKSFGGSVTISLYNDSQQTPRGQQTFKMTQPLQPNSKRVVYFDIPTGLASLQSANGITHFKYAIRVNGQQSNTGGGKITDNYEDTSLF